ncbi:hypothetical protein OH799_14905 [Nocardia sp. NBC_00881]|uniref:hypothetical protein n=1 Tax=Nocardia sp. NBC_00881 TaxID=2975995 RepID=UPI00386D6A26|nr:hypothetical protein OH799_14905 [Nocardia sp. NBC_00881]
MVDLSAANALRISGTGTPRHTRVGSRTNAADCSAANALASRRSGPGRAGPGRAGPGRSAGAYSVSGSGFGLCRRREVYRSHGSSLRVTGRTRALARIPRRHAV